MNAPRHPRPGSGGYSNAAEYVIWATNGHVAEGDLGDFPPGTFDHPVPTDRVHIAEKPEPVARWLVRAVPAGATILDPFAGSGPILRAGLDAAHPVIGVEIDRHYVDLVAASLEARPPTLERPPPLPEPTPLWTDEPTLNVDAVPPTNI